MTESREVTIAQRMDRSQRERLLSEEARIALDGISDDDVKIALGERILLPMGHDVLITAIQADDSGSMAGSKADAVIYGHNLALEELLASPHPEKIWLGTFYLNGNVLNPYRPLREAIRMDSHNYAATGGTPLYDRTAILFKRDQVKTQEAKDTYHPANTMTLNMSDGLDENSRIFRKPESIAPITLSRRASGLHIDAALVIGQTPKEIKAGREIFIKIGYGGEWIFTAMTPDEITQAIDKFGFAASQATNRQTFIYLLESGKAAIDRLPQGGV